MKILISGATGFVGKHLLSSLAKSSHECAVLVRDSKKAHTLYNDIIKIIEYRKDCFDYVKDIRSFNPEIVIHLAGHLTSADDREAVGKLLEANIEFTTHLCSALEKTQAHLFINTGSFSEYYYGDGTLEPAYFYSATKTAARHLIEYFGKKNNYRVVHTIPYTIYGPGGKGKKVIDYLIESAVFGRYASMTDGKQVLDFIYIGDIVDFYCMLIEKQEVINAPVSEYHIGTGKGTSIRELAEIIEEISGKKANVAWGKRPYRFRDIFHSIAPIALAKQDFGWEPKVTLRKGVKILIDSLSQDQHE